MIQWLSLALGTFGTVLSIALVLIQLRDRRPHVSVTYRFDEEYDRIVAKAVRRGGRSVRIRAFGYRIAPSVLIEMEMREMFAYTSRDLPAEIPAEGSIEQGEHIRAIGTALRKRGYGGSVTAAVVAIEENDQEHAGPSLTIPVDEWADLPPPQIVF